MSDFFQKVDLEITQDWTSAKKLVDKLMTCKNSASSIETFGNSTHYNLNSIGVISDHNLSQQWIRVAGPAVTGILPWLPKMIEAMSVLRPDDGAISFIQGDGARHVDFDFLPSALNYIFYCDDDSAHTWIDNSGIIETYPSNIGHAWILNTQVPHGIKSNGKRYSLSIHFGVEYEYVVEWFSTHKNLVFSNR